MVQVNALDSLYRTPLFIASSNEFAEVQKLLIAVGGAQRYLGGSHHAGTPTLSCLAHKKKVVQQRLVVTRLFFAHPVRRDDPGSVPGGAGAGAHAARWRNVRQHASLPSPRAEKQEPLLLPAAVGIGAFFLFLTRRLSVRPPRPSPLPSRRVNIAMQLDESVHWIAPTATSNQDNDSNVRATWRKQTVRLADQ